MALGLVFTDHMPFTTLFKAGKRKLGIIEKKNQKTNNKNKGGWPWEQLECWKILKSTSEPWL